MAISLLLISHLCSSEISDLNFNQIYCKDVYLIGKSTYQKKLKQISPANPKIQVSKIHSHFFDFYTLFRTLCNFNYKTQTHVPIEQ